MGSAVSPFSPRRVDQNRVLAPSARDEFGARPDSQETGLWLNLRQPSPSLHNTSPVTQVGLFPLSAEEDHNMLHSHTHTRERTGSSAETVIFLGSDQATREEPEAQIDAQSPEWQDVADSPTPSTSVPAPTANETTVKEIDAASPEWQDIAETPTASTNVPAPTVKEIVAAINAKADSIHSNEASSQTDDIKGNSRRTSSKFGKEFVAGSDAKAESTHSNESVNQADDIKGKGRKLSSMLAKENDATFNAEAESIHSSDSASQTEDIKGKRRRTSSTFAKEDVAAFSAKAEPVYSNEASSQTNDIKGKGRRTSSMFAKENVPMTVFEEDQHASTLADKEDANVSTSQAMPLFAISGNAQAAKKTPIRKKNKAKNPSGSSSSTTASSRGAGPSIARRVSSKLPQTPTFKKQRNRNRRQQARSEPGGSENDAPSAHSDVNQARRVSAPVPARGGAKNVKAATRPLSKGPGNIGELAAQALVDLHAAGSSQAE